MHLLWFDVSSGADAGRAMRRTLEANSIALLSNAERAGAEDAIDPPSRRWLGSFSPKQEVPGSGLWNINHVGEQYNPAFLVDLSRHVQGM